MGLEVATLAAIATGTAVAGTTYGVYNSIKANKASNKALETERRMEDIKQAKERRRQIREARIVRANMEQQSVAGGTTKSSGANSGIGNISNQLAGNLSFLDTQGELARQASAYNQKASNYRYKTNLASSATSIVDSGFNLFETLNPPKQ